MNDYIFAPQARKILRFYLRQTTKKCWNQRSCLESVGGVVPRSASDSAYREGPETVVAKGRGRGSWKHNGAAKRIFFFIGS